MSSEKQLHGDSLRRQLALSEDYAREHNFTLVDNIDGIPLKDIGVSAFRGVNTTRGVLSNFLQALEEGKIDSGSALLIESLDRLSRDDITNALSQFLGIISLGIEIVTLADKQSYTLETINKNQGQIFVSLGVMIRANEESLMKSKRLGAVWANKRSNALSKPITKVAPAWLKYSEETSNFEIIKERAQVVTTIFEMCINTCGLMSIVRYLNQNSVPTFGKAKLWYKSYLNKIIFNRAVFGEFQPHKLLLGKRVPEGEAIQNYFPKIISENIFYQAHAAISKRTVNKGRNGNSFSNLFAHLTFCGVCGSKMFVRNRGKLPKGGKTLICSKKFNYKNCDMLDCKLPFVESQIFKYLLEVDFSELIGSSSELVTLQNELTSVLAKIEEKSLHLSNTLDLLITNNNLAEASKRLNEKVADLDKDIHQLRNEKTNLEMEIEKIMTQSHAFKSEELKSLLVLIEENADDYYFRSKVNQSLKQVIESITLVPNYQSYLPWELDESDVIFTNFRKNYPKYANTHYSKITRLNEFNNYLSHLGIRILIRYKTGFVRHILVGDDYSFYNGDSRLKTKSS